MTTSSNLDPTVRRFRIREGTAPKFLSRVTDESGTAILKAAVSSISYSIYTLTSSVSQPVLKTSGSLVVNDVWNDTYSTAGWTEDSIGWNVGFTLAASCFSGVDRRGQSYQVEVRATPTSGQPFWIIFAIVDVVDALSITS